MTSRDYPTASSTPKLPPGLAGQSGVHQYSPVRSNSNRPAWDSEVSLSNYSTTAPPPRSSLGAQDSNYSLEKGQYASLGYGAASDSSAQLHPSPRPAPTRPSAKKAWSTRRKLLIGAVVAILAIVGIVLGVVLSRKGSSSSASVAAASAAASSSAPSSAGPSSSAAPAPVFVTSGGDGSMITDETGRTWRYNNTFGGFWVSTPFNDSARAQADVPALNQPWDYSVNLINGVNLGGWFVLEPFITPALFNKSTTIDEWTLSQSLGTSLQSVIENHYNTFMTEYDFAQIASYGLNWIRLPIPFWFIETYQGEPFLQGVGWKYFLKALTWARKYGLRVELDLHTAPGSQNGLNHSGKFGSINWLNGVMGLSNVQRHLNYVRTITEFISQPQYRNVVQMFMHINLSEAYLTTIGEMQMRSYYLETYNMIRSIGGYGEGNGPMIAIHDGFVNQNLWNDFLTGADRLALESHPYLAFSSVNNDSLSSQVTRPCQWWAAGYNQSMANFGFTLAGEWSLAINDCGQYLNGVNLGSNFDGTYNNVAQTVYGSCDGFIDATTFTSDQKAQWADMAAAYMDATRNWMFWTWKTGNSPITGHPTSPLWSYSLGVQYGYIPKNPRLSKGSCNALAQKYGGSPGTYQWTGPLSAWQTGGGSSFTVEAAQVANYSTWPPQSLTNIPDVGNLPTYTATATPKTLSASQPSTVFPAGDTATYAGNGWAQPSDTAGWFVPVAGCSYLNPWSGVGAAVPTGPCTGNAKGKREAPKPTPRPMA